MSSWQEALKRQFTVEGGESAIVGFDDQRKIVELHEKVDPELARRIEAIVRDLRFGYEVKQL